jgi:capsular exopolysaccharide synthesis family protein
MGRIDEALRRASGSPAGTTTVGVDTDDPFVSAWTVDASASARAVPGPAPVPAAPRRHSEVVPVGGELAPAHADGYRRQRLAALAADEPQLVEQFRRLAATLIHNQRSAPLKVVMVTSAAPEEGKTMTAVNLALVLSESFRRRVLLIDADLRRPKITDVASVSGDGLSEALKAAEPRKVPLIGVSEMLTLLPSGHRDPNPLSGLTSPRMQQLLHEASATFEWVIVDTPPVAAAADTSLLCAMADAAVLVVRAGQTPYEAVQRAIDTIGRERIIGVVLNGVDRDVVPSYGSYDQVAEERREG